jgi:hypothetical protein
MKAITISRGDQILAHHTTDSCLSHYGQAVWVVEVLQPSPGPAQWEQDGKKQTINIIDAREGWLVVRQAKDYLCGIIWSDGEYYGNLILKNGKPVKKLTNGCRVKGAVPLGELGSLVPGLI